ncbi:3-dehydroquinate synthase II [Thalassobacillus cyri]|uniref:3-dehydroquinate synthase II n=1 Tax=Thalassobacillus cyri TaxID=571932 RepID=A0A1H4E0W5_9BACI|nr:3-dehydroquinate synthase II [Thalassobacillus cyri]SEA78210.1 3-dehydroquinate synthase II [Thalassobacillus cyri]
MVHEARIEKEFLEVMKIEEVGEGMRVCLDFIDILQPQDGVYVGNTGYGYVKVLSENRESENYPPRPFRINCGSFHQYLYQENKTHYLHELNPGEKINVEGEQEERELSLGRVKIEKRPFVRVECQSEEGTVSVTLQKTTSVHVLEENKGEISMEDLEIGHRILCLKDKPGRHLGEQVDEVIVEK